MRILVTGGSSFVGAWFCHLAARDHEVVAINKRTSVTVPRVRSVRCDLAAPGAANRLGKLKPDAVVHLACKVRGTGDGNRDTEAMRINRRMMDVVLALEVPVVYASSTCVHWPRPTGYARSRRDDELRLRDSAIPWAIVRPCAPYGPRHPTHRPAHTESFHTLADLVRRSPVVPVIGDGRYRRQPIHVDDFNGSLLRLLEKGLPNEAFDAGGSEALSMEALIQSMARYLGKRRRVVRMPKRAVVAALSLSPDFERELVETSDTDDVADPGPLTAVSGLWPRSFQAGLPCLFT